MEAERRAQELDRLEAEAMRLLGSPAVQNDAQWYGQVAAGEQLRALYAIARGLRRIDDRLEGIAARLEEMQ